LRLRLENLVPAPGQHAVFCGINGCGKTTLAEVLLRFFSSVIIFDAKSEIHWKGYQRFKSLRSLVSAHPMRAIYAPTWNELQDPGEHEKFYQYAFRRTKTVVYTDEVTTVCDSSREIPPHYKRCLVQGRSKKVMCFSSTQRPVEVPNFLFSESKHFFCFKLNLEPDRKKVEQMTSIDREKIMALPERYFYYARADGFQSSALTLDLKKEKV